MVREIDLLVISVSYDDYNGGLPEHPLATGGHLIEDQRDSGYIVDFKKLPRRLVIERYKINEQTIRNHRGTVAKLLEDAAGEN